MKPADGDDAMIPEPGDISGQVETTIKNTSKEPECYTMLGDVWRKAGVTSYRIRLVYSINWDSEEL